MRINAGLFRGKSTTTGKWLYGSLLKVTIKGCPIWIIFEDDFDITGDIVKAMSHACVDPDTVGECINVPDKTGKLIFEGDIIQANNGSKTTVVFHCGGFHSYWDSGFGEYYGGIISEFKTVVGNIHDNPELIKGGEG